MLRQLNLETPIETVTVSAFKIPCEIPESDGTLKWDATTMILVSIVADQKIGIGFTYGHASILQIIKDVYSPLLKNSNALNIALLWNLMVQAVRNDGLSGLAAHAISAVDMALWDLKSKILEVPLCQLFGMAQDKIAVYGSGGFTSYTEEQIAKQFHAWQSSGITKFKMKVGRQPDQDYKRVKNAREIIGENAELFVDANGAYQRKQALGLAKKFAEYGVSWFEEPVSSDDLEGLSLLRDRAPAEMNIVAGEYGYNSFYFRKMLEAGSVDILQADATRCCGYTGFMQAAALSHAFHVPLSSHTAPSLHLHVCLALGDVCHMEYFHDHVRIEELFFEGLPKLENGCLYPHLDRPGHGLTLKKSDAEPFLITEVKDDWT